MKIIKIMKLMVLLNFGFQPLSMQVMFCSSDENELEELLSVDKIKLEEFLKAYDAKFFYFFKNNKLVGNRFCNRVRLAIEANKSIDEIADIIHKSAWWKENNADSLLDFLLKNKNHPFVSQVLKSYVYNCRFKNKHTILNYLSKYDSDEVLKFLIELDLIDRDYTKLLFDAAQNNADKIVQLLINKGTDVNVLNHDQDTLLHVAVEYDADKIVQLLINKGTTDKIVQQLINEGTDVHALNDDEDTLLHVAAQYNSDKVAQLLIEQRVDVNALNLDLWTPLHVAAQYNSDKVAQLLIEQRADVNALDHDKNSPLHWAAQYDADKVAQLLIDKKAIMNAVNNENKVPCDLAIDSKSYKVIALYPGICNANVECIF